MDVLFLVISAVTAGCEGWKDIEIYGHSKLNWLRQFRPFNAGIPNRHSIARIFRVIDTDSLVLSLFSWVNEHRQKSAKPVIAFDGKTLRGTSQHLPENLHLVSAFDCESGLTLLHKQVDGKSNEIPAVRALLDMLDITDTVVTLDALHCQKETLKRLTQRQADYVVQVKANQQKLYAAINQCFSKAGEPGASVCSSHSQGHGREEVKQVSLIDASQLPQDILPHWPGVKRIVAVERERSQGHKTSYSTHYYLTSLDHADSIAKAIRQHWLTENQQHWVLDVVFKEDECQIQEPISAQNMALFRRVVRNMVKQHTKSKDSIRGKCVRASFDDNFRAELLFG